MRPIITMRNNIALLGLLDLIDEVVTDKSIVVEIGTYTGESTVLFARKAKKVFTIDPYIQNYDVNDGAGECDMGQIKGVFFERIHQAKLQEKIYQYQETSKEASKHFERQSVDIVYIDGLHTYQGVIEDIENYISIVRKGGYICGHDYDWSEVKRAVDEKFGKPDKVFIDNSWIVKVKW